jgi:hypothetical protein
MSRPVAHASRCGTLREVAMEDEAVALANATTFGLGGSIYTADLDRGRRRWPGRVPASGNKVTVAASTMSMGRRWKP